MICPKCGFEQEERLDCKECGIVFSKYNALFSSSESPDASEEEVLMKNEINNLYMQVRELGSRLMDVEFEKAERKQIRVDLKDMKNQIHQNQAEMNAHMQQIEEKLESLPKESASQITPEVLENLPKSDEIEKKASELKDSLNNTNEQLTDLWETTGQNSSQITELRDQIAYLRNEIHETKSRMESIEKNAINEEPQTIYEDDVKAIRKNLDELGQFISGLGRKP